MGKKLRCFVAIAMFSGATACSTYKTVGSGVVIEERLVAKVDRTADIKTGLYGGATSGALFGAGYGALLGTGCVIISSGACSALIPRMAVAGAVVGLGLGSATGAVAGLGYGTWRQGKGLYHYRVQQNAPDGSELEVEQYSSKLMPAGTKVAIQKRKSGNMTRYRITASKI